jgi:hypothetical protein
MVFFSKNRKTAEKKVRKLAKTKRFYRYKEPSLAKVQIKNRNNLKTWKILNKS